MKHKKVLKTIFWCLALLMAVITIGLFVYPLIKAFMIYQSGITEQEAFNALVVPLIAKCWLSCLVTGSVGIFALGKLFTYRDDE